MSTPKHKIPLPAKEVRRVTVPMQIERRSEDSDTRTLRGYAAVFDSWSENLGWFREKIQPGAFATTLADEANDIRALADHRTDALAVIGRRSAGTLRIEEDERGLKVEIDLPDTSAARDLATNIEAGNVDGMSFGFEAVRDAWHYDEERQLDERTLEEVRLYEVSVVAYPAYPDTSVAARSLESAKEISHETPSVPLLNAAVRRSALRKLKIKNHHA